MWGREATAWQGAGFPSLILREPQYERPHRSEGGDSGSRGRVQRGLPPLILRGPQHERPHPLSEAIEKRKFAG